MTNLLHRYNKFVTVRNTFSKNPRVKFSAFFNPCVKVACCPPELIFEILRACSGVKNASEQFVSCIHSSFVSFALHPTPQTKKSNGMEV